MESDEEPPFEWTPYAELRLLHSLYGLKPVGVCHHFMMIVIWEKFKKSMGVDVPLNVVKKKLKTFYNFDAANETLADNDYQFPIQEFSLPESEFPEVSGSDDSDLVPRKRPKYVTGIQSDTSTPATVVQQSLNLESDKVFCEKKKKTPRSSDDSSSSS